MDLEKYWFIIYNWDQMIEDDYKSLEHLHIVTDEFELIDNIEIGLQTSGYNTELAEQMLKEIGINV